MFYLYEELTRIRIKEVSEEIKRTQQKPLRPTPPKSGRGSAWIKAILHPFWKQRVQASLSCCHCEPEPCCKP